MSETNSERLKNFLFQILKITSPSGSEGAMGDFLLSTFKSFGATKDEVGNIFFQIPGQGEPLFLGAHMDVVSPCTELQPIIEGGWIKNAKQNVFGLDDKVGIAAVYETLVSLPDKHRPLDVLFTVEEETTMRGVKKFDISKLSAKRGVVIDLAAPVSAYVRESPSAYLLNWKVSGPTAHTKFLSTEGQYAWSAVREIIGRSQFGALVGRTNVNWASVEGGTGRNIITQTFELRGEMRSFDNAGAQEFLSSQETLESEVKAKFPNLKIEREALREHEGYSLGDSQMAQEFAAAAERAGLKAEGILSFGLSEANEWRRMGLDIIDIGYGAVDTHTPSERMLVSDLESITNLLGEMIA